jgi:hypothetical protein
MGMLAYTIKQDTAVIMWICRWIREAGGSISVSVLEFKFEERFGYEPRWSRNEEEIRRLGLMNNAFKVKNGEVSYLEGNRYAAA